jgi:hypothetical protein
MSFGFPIGSPTSPVMFADRLSIARSLQALFPVLQRPIRTIQFLRIQKHFLLFLLYTLRTYLDNLQGSNSLWIKTLLPFGSVSLVVSHFDQHVSLFRILSCGSRHRN